MTSSLESISQSPIEVQINGEKFQLFAERAMYRMANQTLLVADLHWGKAEVFQRSGVAVSSEVLHSDLARLSRVLVKSGARRLVILGDLIHAPVGITDDVIRTVSEWRTRHLDLRMELIRGNHDRKFQLPESWAITVHDHSLDEDGFLLTHDAPPSRVKSHVLGGHIHPVIKMKSGGDSLRLPCFAIGKFNSLLPAFSEFTGGFEIKHRDWLRLFVVTDDAVIQV